MLWASPRRSLYPKRMAEFLDALSEFWQARQARAIIRDPVPYWSSQQWPQWVLLQKNEFNRKNEYEGVTINHELNFALDVFERRYPAWRDKETPAQRTKRLGYWFEVVHLPFRRNFYASDCGPYAKVDAETGLDFDPVTGFLNLERWEGDFSWLAQNDLDLLERAWEHRKELISEHPSLFYSSTYCYEGPLPWDPPDYHWTWWIRRPEGPFDAFGRALEGFYHVAEPSVSDLIKKDEQHLYSLLIDAEAEETKFFRRLVNSINDRLLVEPGPWATMFPHLRADAINAVEKWLEEYPTALESGLWFVRQGGSDDGEKLSGFYDQCRLEARAWFCELTGREAWRIVERDCPCGERLRFEIPPEGNWNRQYCPKCGRLRPIDFHGDLSISPREQPH